MWEGRIEPVLAHLRRMRWRVIGALFVLLLVCELLHVGEGWWNVVCPLTCMFLWWLPGIATTVHYFRVGYRDGRPASRS